MEIGLRIRELREWKNLSQGDIEKVTGLLHCYTRRELREFAKVLSRMEERGRKLLLGMAERMAARTRG
jgi:transcriptional regulator with XRE-family HTH domain